MRYKTRWGKKMKFNTLLSILMSCKSLINFKKEQIFYLSYDISSCFNDKFCLIRKRTYMYTQHYTVNTRHGSLVGSLSTA